MAYLDIISEMINTLTNEFEQKYSEDEKRELSEFPNRFNNGYETKYDYLRHEYIIENGINYLKDYYEKNKVTEEDKNTILKWMYNNGFVLFNNDYSLIREDFKDIDFLKQTIYDKRVDLIAKIFHTSIEREKLYSNIKYGPEYNGLSKELPDLLKTYIEMGEDNLELYNNILNDFCQMDEEGYSICDFLKEKCLLLNSSNIESIISNIDNKGNTELRNVDTYVKKSDAFYEGMTNNKKIKYLNDDKMPDLIEKLRTYDEHKKVK